MNPLHIYTSAHTITKFLRTGKNHANTEKIRKKVEDAKKIFFFFKMQSRQWTGMTLQVTRKAHQAVLTGP